MLTEEQIFDFLCRKYIQRAASFEAFVFPEIGKRQKEMNLQYTEAETHDLAKALHNLFTFAFDQSLENARQQLISQGHTYVSLEDPT